MSELPLAQVPESLRKFVNPSAPAAMRTMAAKGLVPIPPKDLVFVQCLLVGSSDEAVAQAADKSLRGYPDSILKPIVKAEWPAMVLDALGTRIVGKAALLEDFLLNRAVSDDTLARLAPDLGEPSVNLLLQNEERLLRSSALVLALKDHTSASRAGIDRMFDFLVRAGVIFDGVPEFADALQRLSNDERMQAVAAIELPLDLLDPGLNGEPLEPTLELEAELMEVGDPVAIAEVADKLAAEKAVPLLKRIGLMTIAQKVALALKGNREVRSTLLRDTNKVVAVAAIKNPRITEQEVQMSAGSRAANEEVVRIISNNRDWTKSYAIKLALVTNPKTPQGIAMRFLPLLNHSDLRNISKSKNVPSQIASQARAILSRTKH